MVTPPTVRQRLTRRRRLLFALVPLLALLLVGEVLARLNRGPTWFGSYRQLRLDLMARNYPAALDPVLGYVPRANFASEDNHWGTRVTIDADGLRGNGAPPPPGERVVVAVGDSFTFGDQVDDDATWPALLEQRLGTPVKNGGVFGYSLTQAVLRGEQLVERFPTDVLIVSFIPDDLRRCEFSRRYTAVPWFDLVDGRLVFQPIPPGAVGPRVHGFKDLIAHSALVDVLMTAIDRRWWFENEKQVEVPHLAGRGEQIGKLLIERIADRCHARGVRLLVVLQDAVATPAALAVLRHAESLGVATLDLASRYATMTQADEEVTEDWFDGHMTREGNAWVAAQIEAALRPH
jgi:hypothetical protein